MADIVKINKNIQYQTHSVLYGLLAGETKPLEFINKNFASHIIDAYLKDGTFELFTQKQEVPVLDNKQNVSLEIASQPIQDIDTQDNTQPQAFEIMYKTTQPIQDKDGNEIEVGSQFAESELKELIVVDQRKSNKKIKELLQDEKLIEIKKLPQ